VLGDDLLGELAENKDRLLVWLERHRNETGVPRKRISAVPRTERMPLSFAQERLWFLDRLAPGSAAYVVPVAARIKGCLDVAALQGSLNAIVDRHEVLRTRYLEISGEPCQRIEESVSVPLVTIDLRHLGPAEREHEVQRLAHQDALRPFDLSNGPLLRATLLILAEREHALLLAMHHIVSDGWSQGVLRRELGILYDAAVKHREAELPELPVQYADFAVWQRETLTGEALEVDMTFWRHVLNGLQPLDLPTDKRRPPIPSTRGRSELVELSRELTRNLELFGHQRRATLFMTLLSAFMVLMKRYAGKDDIAVGTPIANRKGKEIEDLIGFFVNMLVMRADLSGDPTFEELLTEVSSRAAEAYDHQDLPFEKLVEELEPERDLSRNPLFQVAFVVQNVPYEHTPLEGVTIEQLADEIYSTHFDLELHVQQHGDMLRLVLIYSEDLFESETMGRMLVHYQRILEQICETSDRPISEFSLLDAAERRQLVDGWNKTSTAYPRDVSVQSLFEQQVELRPDAIAVQCGTECLSYAELNLLANRIASRLRQLDVGVDVPVGVLLERSPMMIAAWLGVLKAGGAYVPLDPEYPEARLENMLADSSASVLLTHSGLTQRVAEFAGEQVCLDLAWLGGMAADPIEPVAAEPEALAYIIYTSGSSGDPKGVAIEHRGLTNLVYWHRHAYQITPDDRATQYAGMSFDAGVWEVWPYLTAGASLHLVEDEVRYAPARLLSWLAAERITVSFLPTPIAQAVLDEPLPADLALRVLLTGGDRLHGGLPDRLPFMLVNHYGPTENTVVSTCAEVDPEDAMPPIGWPIDNTRAYVLDERMEPVPIGVPGELFVGGDGLARGYWNRPELTAQKFVVSPFDDDPQVRLYRTGDLVRHRKDGALEFLGRLDDQVKIRGFRIELGEVEAVLREHQAVADVVALRREEVTGEEDLVAYVVPAVSMAQVHTGAGAWETELREYLRSRLPRYMVPSALVVLETLPLTPNGKVDRDALPAPEQSESLICGEYVAPSGTTEVQLASIFAGTLELERVGGSDNFFDLGGHSLLAMRVVAQVRERLQVELPLAELIEYPTVADLARRVEHHRAALMPGLCGPTIQIANVPRDRPLPMSFAQQRLWFLDQLTPGSAAYNICGALHLKGSLNREALRDSLADIVVRHETLRTTFHGVADGDPVQIIHTPSAGYLEAQDLSTLAPHNRPAAVAAAVAREASRPFALDRDSMLRVRLLVLGNDEHVLVLSIHHIAADGWSLEVLLTELAVLYRAYAREEAAGLDRLPLQYADFAVWQRERLHGEYLEQQMAYWRRQLEGLTPVNLPISGVRPETQTFAGAALSIHMTPDLGQRLRTLCASMDATPFMALAAVFALLISRYSDQDDVVFGSPVANRRWTQVQGLIGFFLNTLPLRFDLSGAPTVRELIARARAVAMGAYDHQDLPFEKLVEDLEPQRDLSRNPLFQILFAHLEDSRNPIELDGLDVELWEHRPTTTRFDLEVHVATGSSGLRVTFIYNTDLFEAHAIKRMLQHFERLIEAALDQPDAIAWELPMLKPHERTRVLEGWSRGQAKQNLDLPVHALFEAVAAGSPDAVAVTDGSNELSYAELNAQANRLARQLQDYGARSDTVVGICAQRSLEMAVAVLGILKSGACYAALDPQYPYERLQFMLEDAAMSLLLVQPHLRDRVAGAEIRTLDLDLEAAPWVARSAENLNCESGTSQAAYVIYTSGSTGKPKGVVMPHRVLSNLVQWQLERTVAGRRARTLQYASLSFDVSFQEMFSTWCGGGTLVMIPDELRRDANALLRLVDAMEIERMFLPFAALQQLAQAGADCSLAPASLREIITAGEPLHVTPCIVEWFRALGGCVLDNQYGPSESHVVSAQMLLGDPQCWPAFPVIGYPIDNACIYILDRHAQPVPVGVPGELCIGGVSVSRGYLGREQLTRERFVPDPFGSEPGARLYKTGDRARYATDGTIEFLGRVDDQVKIRGYRVELGEVEMVLAGFPGMHETAVAVRRQGAQEGCLVAYVVGEAGQEMDPVELRTYLRAHIPEFMVPSVYVSMQRLPLTPSGKVDRRSLPAPMGVRQVEAAYLAPRTDTEEILAAIWIDVLDVEQVGVHDNFFDLGGHSLLATRVVNRMRAAFKVELPLLYLFELPTVAALAERVDGLLRLAPHGEPADSSDREELVL